MEKKYIKQVEMFENFMEKIRVNPEKLEIGCYQFMDKNNRLVILVQESLTENEEKQIFYATECVAENGGTIHVSMLKASKRSHIEGYELLNERGHLAFYERDLPKKVYDFCYYSVEWSLLDETPDAYIIVK